MDFKNYKLYIASTVFLIESHFQYYHIYAGSFEMNISFKIHMIYANLTNNYTPLTLVFTINLNCQLTSKGLGECY